MLDLSTLVVSGCAHNLTPASGTPGVGSVKFLSPSLSGLLSSARITIGGVEVSACNYIARTEHMLSLMQSDEVRRSDFASGFGMKDASASDVYGECCSQPIPAAESWDAVWRPRSLGILDMESFLPISLVPAGSMILELTMADTAEEYVDTTS